MINGEGTYLPPATQQLPPPPPYTPINHPAATNCSPAGRYIPPAHLLRYHPYNHAYHIMYPYSSSAQRGYNPMFSNTHSTFKCSGSRSGSNARNDVTHSNGLAPVTEQEDLVDLLLTAEEWRVFASDPFSLFSLSFSAV
ncbi:hypothetical protein BT69DRAFT_575479 [Atractiella rhizophila]|nr:hypothetical protein BT69DRAFT_575479 [Atractiella rhizophila]